MANSLYDKGRESFLGTGSNTVSWASDTIKALLVTSSYTPNLATHQFVSDIGGGNIVARSSAFTSKTTSAGVADAADITYTALTGSAVTYIVLYKDTGSDSTSPLIGIIDTATGLPFTPSGGDVTISWDNGSNRIFKL